MKNDGLQILIKWLSHFSSEHNRAFLLDTLKTLGHLPLNLETISQNDIDELQLKIAELASAESGVEKGQCLWYIHQLKSHAEPETTPGTTPNGGGSEERLFSTTRFAYAHTS